MDSFKIIKLFKLPEGDNTANPLIPLIPSHSKLKHLCTHVYMKGITLSDGLVQSREKTPRRFMNIL